MAVIGLHRVIIVVVVVVVIVVVSFCFTCGVLFCTILVVRLVYSILRSRNCSRTCSRSSSDSGLVTQVALRNGVLGRIVVSLTLGRAVVVVGAVISRAVASRRIALLSSLVISPRSTCTSGKL